MQARRTSVGHDLRGPFTHLLRSGAVSRMSLSGPCQRRYQIVLRAPAADIAHTVSIPRKSVTRMPNYSYGPSFTIFIPQAYQMAYHSRR